MDAPAYTPNPETNIKLAMFLNALSECGNVTAACEASYLTRTVVLRIKASSPLFATDYGIAESMGADGLEDEARRRAFTGWDEPVFYKDSVVGQKRKFSDTLIQFLIKGAKPEKYADRTKNENLNANMQVEPMDRAERQRRFDSLVAISEHRLKQAGDLA